MKRRRPQPQALGEVVTGSSSPWTPAAEARGGNQRLVLHASSPPVMRRRELLPARARVPMIIILVKNKKNDNSSGMYSSDSNISYSYQNN
jgi:hypothetical protein